MENFLLHDCGPGEGSNRILIFGREKNIRLAGRTNNDITQIYLDGTFKIIPSLYKDGQVSKFAFFSLLNHQSIQRK